MTADISGTELLKLCERQNAGELRIETLTWGPTRHGKGRISAKTILTQWRVTYRLLKSVENTG
jgi:hypothetical protein